MNLGEEKIVNLLIQKGVNIDHVNKDGNTALHIAVEKGKKNKFEVLGVMYPSRNKFVKFFRTLNFFTHTDSLNFH